MGKSRKNNIKITQSTPKVFCEFCPGEHAENQPCIKSNKINESPIDKIRREKFGY